MRVIPRSSLSRVINTQRVEVTEILHNPSSFPWKLLVGRDEQCLKIDLPRSILFSADQSRHAQGHKNEGACTRPCGLSPSEPLATDTGSLLGSWQRDEKGTKAWHYRGGHADLGGGCWYDLCGLVMSSWRRRLTPHVLRARRSCVHHEIKRSDNS
jgi:hypothetical protein